MFLSGEQTEDAVKLRVYLKSLDERYENSTLAFLDKIAEST